MEKLYNKEVIDFVDRCMTEIKPELDIDYCRENNLSFENNEKNALDVEFFSKEATDIAYKILYPDFEEED